MSTAVSLRLSADRKVSPVVRVQASKQAPLLFNSFGLPAGVSCPGRTAFCDGCYAERTERVFTSSGRLVAANFERLSACGDDIGAMVDLLTVTVNEFVVQLGKLERAGRATPEDRIFRIHWDGDFYSEAYTIAWRRVVEAFPDVQFWCYTRSFGWAWHLVGLPNLAVYLSVDVHNVGWAVEVLAEHPSLLVAVCADTQADARVIADKLDRRAVPCPENVGRIPRVMHASGRRSMTPEVGTDGKGACASCRLCVDGVRDVAFAVRGR